MEKEIFKDAKAFEKCYADMQSSKISVKYAAEQEFYNGLVRFVYYIGREKFPTYIANERYSDDLIQAGWEGVCNALPNYNASVCAPSTYFYFPILHAMSKQINMMTGVTSYQIRIAKIIKQGIADLTQDGNPNPSCTDIAHHTHLKPNVVRRYLEDKKKVESYDALTSSTNQYSAVGLRTNTQMMEDPSEESNPYLCAVNKEEKENLLKAIDELPKDQKYVIQARYGLLEGNDSQQIYADISKAMHLPTESVKWLESLAKETLRRNPTLKGQHSDIIKANAVNVLVEQQNINIVPEDTALELMTFFDA